MWERKGEKVYDEYMWPNSVKFLFVCQWNRQNAFFICFALQWIKLKSRTEYRSHRLKNWNWFFSMFYGRKNQPVAVTMIRYCDFPRGYSKHYRRYNSKYIDMYNRVIFDFVLNVSSLAVQYASSIFWCSLFWHLVNNVNWYQLNKQTSKWDYLCKLFEII